MKTPGLPIAADRVFFFLAGDICQEERVTSNAMASMDVVTRKYGPSPVAYFAIPMVGGMFIDFVNAFVNTMMINMWAIS